MQRPSNVRGQEALGWAADSYRMLLEYSRFSGISILVENHGGVSDNADWMLALMKEVADPAFGTYPDWRKPGLDYDNFEYLQK